eukprot:superscaffoldBa00000121_g1761
MFATATRNFVEEVDHGGLLIPVSSLNDSIDLLTVVVTQKRFWFWQKPKHLRTDFSLNDILTGDTPIKPVVIETDFIKYDGTYGDNIQGTMDASFVLSNVTIEGKDSSKLQSSFGSLKKEEVDVQKLLRDSKGRSVPQTKLEQLSDHFQLLSALPASTRSSLLEQITKVMEDQTAVSALQNLLDQMCLDKSPTLGDVMMTESQKQNIQAILGLLEQKVDSAQTKQSTSVLSALHLITSALDEMTYDCLAVLAMCCSPTVLKALELLVQCLAGSGELPVSSAGLAALTEDVYVKAEHLFASSNVYLKRDRDTVKTKINHQPGHLPLVVCIAVRGLASLAH